MKKYNENILKATKKLSSNTLHKSKKTVNKLANPSHKAARVGACIGITAGIGLVISGVILIILNYKWGVWMSIAGVVTIISNVIQSKRTNNI